MGYVHQIRQNPSFSLNHLSLGVFTTLHQNRRLLSPSPPSSTTFNNQKTEPKSIIFYAIFRFLSKPNWSSPSNFNTQMLEATSVTTAILTYYIHTAETTTSSISVTISTFQHLHPPFPLPLKT
ncbi:hypothetical protein L2E82_35598 [Cichorium intybus]|uniref:Uncharacterized protein n=1 Tax=Cichorium intybus TaxID=13427 RepID=A0ACB9BPA5_CICIN|nr:hypothetical protein L2E82_35598 [Cichorium intybus]